MSSAVALTDPRERLSDLFKEIASLVDSLVEENEDLKKKLKHYEPEISHVKKKVDFMDKLNQAVGKVKNAVPKRKMPGNENIEFSAIRSYTGHKDGVWEVSTFLWSAGIFASASADGTARVWSAEGTLGFYTYTDHGGSVNSVRGHPTNRLFCTASGDGKCRVWTVPYMRLNKSAKDKSNTEIDRDPIAKDIRGLWTPLLSNGGMSSSSSSSSHFFSSSHVASSSGTELAPEDEAPVRAPIRVPAAEFFVASGVRSLPLVGADWADRGDRVVIVNSAGSVRCFDNSSGRLTFSLNLTLPPGSEVSFMTTSLSHHLVHVGDNTGSVHAIDLRTSEGSVASFEAHEGSLNCCRLAADDVSLVTSGEDACLKVWDTRKLSTPSLLIRCNSNINRFSMSLVAGFVAAPCDDKKLRVYDLKSDKRLIKVRDEKRAHSAMVCSAAWSVDETVIYTGSFDSVVKAWGCN